MAGSSVVRCRGARVIAPHPRQPRVDDLLPHHQLLSEEDEPELVVARGLPLGNGIISFLHAHKGDGERQPVVVGVDGAKQLLRLQGAGVRGRCQVDVFVRDAEVSPGAIFSAEEASRDEDRVQVCRGRE